MGVIVLAGGKSSRMGQDKALIHFNGMTLLEHVVATVFTLSHDIVIVTDVPNKYALPCGRAVADIFPDSGPVGGILTGLTTLGTGSHIVVACDMPSLNIMVLQLLLKAANPDWDAIVPEVAGRPEALCAVYSHTAVPRLMKFLETGERAAYKALETLRAKRIGEGVLRRIDPDLKCFTNINTQEDLDRLLQPISPLRR